MVRQLFDVPQPRIPVTGSERFFPVHRIYCVGRNYAAHAREMGTDPDREPPFYFMKPADTVVAGGGDVRYPPKTSELHHEVELVVAIGKGGRSYPVSSPWRRATCCSPARRPASRQSSQVTKSRVE